MAADPRTRASAGGTLAARPVRLNPTVCAKPWGRLDLGAWGVGQLPDGAPIGEIHHLMPADLAADAPLLVKTLFTSERLSVQVHPDAAAAEGEGGACGKDEAWVVLAAEPGATIGLGLREPCSMERLRLAALDGSIVDMLEWHGCTAGDVFYVPSGTIHAIGGGVTLFEVQQNVDLTYRLFDYGRGRELHLEQGLAVSRASPWRRGAPPGSPGQGRELLVESPAFLLERVRVTRPSRLRPAPGRPVWLAVVDGKGRLGDADFATGEVWLLADETVVSGSAALLLAYPGNEAVADLWRGD